MTHAEVRVFAPPATTPKGRGRRPARRVETFTTAQQQAEPTPTAADADTPEQEDTAAAGQPPPAPRRARRPRGQQP